MLNAGHSKESNTATLPPPPCPSVALAVEENITSCAGPGAEPTVKIIPLGSPRRPERKNTRKSPVRMEAGVCLASALRDRWRTYRKQLRHCQKDFSETSIHQLRVATRRLMTQCVLVSSTTTGGKAERARKKLKGRLNLLGELRDIQVQRMFLEKQLLRFPEIALIVNLLRRRERVLAKAVTRKVGGARTKKLGKWISALCEEIASCPGNAAKHDLIQANVMSSLKSAFAEVCQRRKTINPGDSETIHRTRVAFKKLRYMTEALSPVFTGLGKGELRRFAHYQRRMGTLQDLEIVQSCVSRFLHEHSGTEPLLRRFSGYLRMRQRRALRTCLEHADDLIGFHATVGRDWRYGLSRVESRTGLYSNGLSRVS